MPPRPLLTSADRSLVQPPSRSKKSFSISKAGNLLKARSSTNLSKQRHSEANSIAETVSSRDSYDGASSNTTARPRTNSRPSSGGLFHTVRKKVSQKFSKQGLSASTSEPRNDIPPVPSLYSVPSASRSYIQASPPPAASTFSITRRTNKRTKRNQSGPHSGEYISEFGSFTGQDLVLDTDLEKMDGIVDPIVLMTGTSSRNAGTSRGSMGQSTASVSPTHSEWDANHGQSSSFGTSDASSTNNATNPVMLSYSPPHISPIFTDPFTPSTSRVLATSPSSLRLSPKTVTAPSLQSRPLSSETQRRAQSLIPPTAQYPQAQAQIDTTSSLQAWNPPESWAVHEEAPVEYDDSSSEESTFEADVDPSHPAIARNGRRLGSRQGSDIGTFKIPGRSGHFARDSDFGIDDEMEARSRSITGPGILQVCACIIILFSQALTNPTSVSNTSASGGWKDPQGQTASDSDCPRPLRQLAQTDRDDQGEPSTVSAGARTRWGNLRLSGRKY
jgi:adenylate cyclase